jgi:hypothetical protein
MRRGRSYPLLSNSYHLILVDSTSFVRFDGKMSAKRRRDAINRFSVPLEREQSIPQRRNARNERPTTRDDEFCDSDSMVIDDDDDFIDDSDDEQVFGKKSKRKGKGKAKDARSGSADGDENPRVMLLSLKAVCCFLNNQDFLIIYEILGCAWFKFDWYLLLRFYPCHSLTQDACFSCQ